MPLPLLAAIPVVGTIITSIGLMTTTVVTYVVAKLTAKAFFTGSQIFVAFLLITAHFAMLGFFLYAIMFIYNQYNALLQMITDMSSQSDLLSISFNVLQAMGVINAFNDVFSIFSPFILSYLVYKSGLIVFHSLQATSNELFKIGVLTQQ